MAHFLKSFLQIVPIQPYLEEVQIFCRRLDSNHGPLDLEATALPTEHQAMPYLSIWPMYYHPMII